MPYRRSSGQRHRRKPTRVRIVPYVVPRKRRAPDHSMLLTVPTRWIQNIVAHIFLPSIAVYGIASLFFSVAPYGQLLYATLGITWAFHLTFTCWMIPKDQTDLSDHGTFFSLVFIYVMNLLLLSILLVIASPQITFASFGADLVENLRSFSEWVGGLMNHFTRGHVVPVKLPNQRHRR